MVVLYMESGNRSLVRDIGSVRGNCEGYTTPYNDSPFPWELKVMMSITINRDTLQYESMGV